MLQVMTDIIKDTFFDTVKLVPFLFLTYLAMEYLEHRTGEKTQRLVRRAGRLGPVLGGLLGVIPQCGFSAAASNLYAGRVISLGTLMAIYLSTLRKGAGGTYFAPPSGKGGCRHGCGPDPGCGLEKGRSPGA